jgi:hypothetical protein
MSFRPLGFRLTAALAALVMTGILFLSVALDSDGYSASAPLGGADASADIQSAQSAQ